MLRPESYLLLTCSPPSLGCRACTFSAPAAGPTVFSHNFHTINYHDSKRFSDWQRRKRERNKSLPHPNKFQMSYGKRKQVRRAARRAERGRRLICVEFNQHIWRTHICVLSQVDVWLGAGGDLGQGGSSVACRVVSRQVVIPRGSIGFWECSEPVFSVCKTWMKVREALGVGPEN
jgi:hypothetical protein